MGLYVEGVHNFRIPYLLSGLNFPKLTSICFDLNEDEDCRFKIFCETEFLEVLPNVENITIYLSYDNVWSFRNYLKEYKELKEDKVTDEKIEASWDSMMWDDVIKTAVGDWFHRGKFIDKVFKEVIIEY